MRIQLLTTCLFCLLSCSEKKKSKQIEYIPGFETLKISDKTRLYKPNTSPDNYLHSRPLDIDIWYPALRNNDTALLFRDLLGLLEKRANYYTASTASVGLTVQLAQSFCEGYKCSDSSRLLNFKTGTFQNAEPVKKKFPVIVYLSSFNGMGYENFTLFEKLAASGYIVISINSIGRYPGDMTMKKEDLLEQVLDASATLAYLKERPNMDFTKVGIIGYSWGGLAGAILASKVPNVACLISLDGSEFHHYGQIEQENIDFENIKNSNVFKSMLLSMPYLRLESSPVGSVNKDSIYNFSEKIQGVKLVVKIDSAEHQDFSCLPFIVKTSGNCRNYRFYENIEARTSIFLNRYLQVD